MQRPAEMSLGWGSARGTGREAQAGMGLRKWEKAPEWREPLCLRLSILPLCPEASLIPTCNSISDLCLKCVFLHLSRKPVLRFQPMQTSHPEHAAVR